MAITDQIAQIQTLVSETVTLLGDGDTKTAKLKLAQIRLLLATSPMEMRDEFAQLRMNDAGSVNELLKSLEEQIAEIETGGEFKIERIPINLGPGDDSCAYEL